MASPTWRERLYLSAKELRQRAKKEDDLANLAAKDGDERFVKMHRNDAALWREEARKKEYEQP